MKKAKECLSHIERSTEVDENLDKLAQKIFITEKEDGQIINYYIPSRKLTKPYRWNVISDLLSDDFVDKFGDYEYRLLDKLLFPSKPAPIICIVGAIGTGKSMTVKMIVNAINSIGHCQRGHTKRNVCFVDLNQYAEFSDKNELFDVLIEAIHIALNDVVPDMLRMEKEISSFWPLLVKGEGDFSTKLVRGALIDELKHDNLMKFDDCSANMDQYIEEYKKLKENKEWYFQYLLLLWRYVKREHFRDDMQCCLFVIDNIDWQPPPIQEKIISRILPYAHLSNSPFLLAMRPAAYFHNKLGARLVDIEEQEGPKPFPVIIDCLHKFERAPAPYLDKTAYAIEPLSSTIIGDLRLLRQAMEEGDVFESFVNNMFGDNVRASLASVHTITKFKEEPSKSEVRVSPHMLNRLLIRRGKQYFEYIDNRDIETQV